MEDKNKKFTIAVISLAVLALVTITIWEPGQWSFRDSTDYDEQARLAQEELEMYREFLASIEPNVAASQQFLEKIATEDIVRSEVNQTLRVNQPVSVPQLANSELNISNRNDRDFMINYLTASSSMLANYRESIQSSVQEVFTTSSNPATLTAAAAETSRLITNLKEMSVPTSAVELHKASIVGLDQYAQMFTEARNYSMRTNEDPWPRLYSQYAVIDNRMAVVNSELERINRTFALGPDVELPKFSLVKTANAQFVVTVATDWQAILFDAVKTGLARAFANFSIVMLDKLVGHIEKSFAIASQLYYSNELGRFYSVEYMQRFVSDPLDQDIISKFIPEYFCIAPDGRQLRDIFVAKARDNVGN
ncbi:MAG TPA: hypothetical protein PKD79_02880, partial [Candidatus Doudnabacteria bacterium]|nr:hypothetical protein [Candidatus Doudnabacteria bacterium]